MLLIPQPVLFAYTHVHLCDMSSFPWERALPTHIVTNNNKPYVIIAGITVVDMIALSCEVYLCVSVSSYIMTPLWIYNT